MTADQEREKRVQELIQKLLKLGVSEKAVREKYSLSADANISSLTDDQCKELNEIGRKIHGGQLKIKDVFPLKNYAPGAAQ